MAVPGSPTVAGGRPAACELARRLCAAGVPLVVVGGAARWLRTPTAAPPNDLDVLLPPTAPALAALRAALPGVDGVTRTRAPRVAADLADWEPWQLRTSLGGLDVFVLRRPAEDSTDVVLDGVRIPTVLRSAMSAA